MFFPTDFVIDWNKIPLSLASAAAFSTMHIKAYLQLPAKGLMNALHSGIVTNVWQ